MSKMEPEHFHLDVGSSPDVREGVFIFHNTEECNEDDAVVYNMEQAIRWMMQHLIDAHKGELEEKEAELAVEESKSRHLAGSSGNNKLPSPFSIVK
jgi:hypothetical protein